MAGYGYGYFQGGVPIGSNVNPPPDVLYDGNTTQWLDLSDETTVTKDVDNYVSKVTDKLGSGQDIVQVTTGLKPLYTGESLLFDGINDYMRGMYNLLQPETLYVVFKIKTFTYSKVLFDGFRNMSCYLSMAAGGDGNLKISAGVSSPIFNSPVNEKVILRLVLNGANSRRTLNQNLTVTENLGTNKMDGICLGCSGSLNNYSNIEIYEVITRKIADDENTELAIYNYLKKKNRVMNPVYETLSQYVYYAEPNSVSIGDVSFTKIATEPIGCGTGLTYVAKKVEDAYTMNNTVSDIGIALSNPTLIRFVEETINCEVLHISENYIYYQGDKRSFYRMNKHTFADKVKFTISGEGEGALDFSQQDIWGVNELPDSGLLIQIDDFVGGVNYSNFYKVPFVSQTSGNYEYTSALFSFGCPTRKVILTSAWGFSTKGTKVFAVIYGGIGQAYLSHDSGDTWECVFSMADSSINATVPVEKEIFVDTKPDGLGGFGAIGGHPMKDTLTNPQTYDLWAVTANGNLHSHGGCIDLYSNRIFVVTGDGMPALGVYYSDDWGYSWTLILLSDLKPSSAFGTQFVTVIPLQNCVLFGCDGMGDGYWRVFRDGLNLKTKPECVYQFNGSNTVLVTISGGNYFAPDGLMLGLINPEGEDDYTTTKGGIVATKNGHNFAKLYEDSFTEMTAATAEFGWRGLISVNNNNKVIIMAKNGGIITLDMNVD